MQCQVTRLQADAHPLVYSSWIRGHWDGCGAVRQSLTQSEHAGIVQARAHRLLADRGTIALALTNEVDTWCGGWLLATRDADRLAIHWLYVRAPYRGLGLSRLLMRAALAECGGERLAVEATHVSDRWRAKMASEGIRLGRLWSKRDERKEQDAAE